MADEETYTVYSVMDHEEKNPLGTAILKDGKYTGEGTWKGISESVLDFGEGWTMDELQSEARTNVFVPGRRVEKREPEAGTEVEVQAEGEIAKADEERQMVFGWAYVAFSKSGELNVDRSGDFIDDVQEVEKSAYNFVVKSRNGDLDHTNLKSAVMVESMVFTPEKIEKMGIPEGTVPLGWWVGFHFPDKADWEQAKVRKAFSIHGKGTRKSVSE